MNILIDTHAHLYPVHDPALYLDNAWSAFERASPGSEKALVLTERATERYFERARASGTLGLHPVRSTREATSLRVVLGGDRTLYLISGAQFVSVEGLEVLSLCGAPDVPDRSPARDILRAIEASGSLAVLPWSFGKWLGRRGRVLQSIIDDPSLTFFLGDIFGRSSGFGGENFFRAARTAHRSIVYGTDPLPLAGEEQYAGIFVTRVSGPFDPELPSLSIRSLLSGRPEPLGTRAPLSAGILRQAKLRLKF